MDEWDETLKRFNERTARRRARAKENDEKAQQIIREAEDRHATDKPADQ